MYLWACSAATIERISECTFTLPAKIYTLRQTNWFDISETYAGWQTKGIQYRVSENVFDCRYVRREIQYKVSDVAVYIEPGRDVHSDEYHFVLMYCAEWGKRTTFAAVPRFFYLFCTQCILLFMKIANIFLYVYTGKNQRISLDLYFCRVVTLG